MSLTISAAPPATHVSPTAGPGPKTSTPRSAAEPVVAQSSAGSASASTSQQTAALNQLLSKYKSDLSRGMAASALSGLGRQIMASAKAAGQHVTLPRAPANASAVPASPVASAASETDKVDVTA